MELALTLNSILTLIALTLALAALWKDKEEPEPITIDWQGVRAKEPKKFPHKSHTFLSRKEKDELVDYAASNPDLDKRALATMYDISYSTLCRIIQEK